MFTISLKTQKEFELVNRSGKKFHCPYFTAVIIKDFTEIITNEKLIGSNNIFYFGMKVGKKLSKAAVIRNKIKRRIRHLIRLLLNTDKQLAPQNFLKKIIHSHNWGVIIIPRKGFEKFEFVNIFQEIEKMFLKL